MVNVCFYQCGFYLFESQTIFGQFSKSISWVQVLLLIQHYSKCGTAVICHAKPKIPKMRYSDYITVVGTSFSFAEYAFVMLHGYFYSCKILVSLPSSTFVKLLRDGFRRMDKRWRNVHQHMGHQRVCRLNTYIFQANQYRLRSTNNPAKHPSQNRFAMIYLDIDNGLHLLRAFYSKIFSCGCFAFRNALAAMLWLISRLRKRGGKVKHPLEINSSRKWWILKRRNK